MNTNGNGIFWKFKESPDGTYIDDFGKTYVIESVDSDGYKELIDKTGFKEHWSGIRFLELAGIRKKQK